MNCLIMATFIEAKPFIETIPLTKCNDTPFPVFQKEETVLVISGMGKVNAAMATAYGCMKYLPDYVLNLGAAGTTAFSASLGEIFQVKEAIEYDGFPFKSKKLPSYAPYILPGFQTATIATQDVPVIDTTHRESVSASAELVDMEASAIIQVCKKFQTRCVLFKFVTDTPDHTRDGEIEKHIRQYRMPFYQFITGSVLPVLKGKN